LKNGNLKFREKWYLETSTPLPLKKSTVQKKMIWFSLIQPQAHKTKKKKLWYERKQEILL
jgi:hypothetical protein